MQNEESSRFTVAWAVRAGGAGRTERRYRDFVIDGISFSQRIAADVISPFGWGSHGSQLEAVDRLRRKAPADLPGNRTSIYVCPECGDLGCGALSAVVEGGSGVVIWRDFGLQTPHDPEVQHAGFEQLGPFTFDGREYHEVLGRLTLTASGT